MNSYGARAARRPGGAAVVLALLSFTILTAPAQADPPAASLVRIEEDWELVVQEPDDGSNAPQITCVISPVGGVGSLYAAFEVNHQSYPDYVPGGLQLQVWNGETHLVSKKLHERGELCHTGETVCWTQAMELQGGTLTFEVVDGTSTTWGSFGGQGNLTASFTTDLANLNAYSPSVSAEHSGVGYASNRVASLVLKRVRAFSSDGQMLQYDTPHVVHNDD